MPITGGIKFFDKSLSLARDGASAVASSNTGAADHVISMQRSARWDSVGSDDTTLETITINLAPTKTMTIDRLFIITHNLLDFSVTYVAGATDFTSVVGINGPLGGGIVETAFAQNTAYYEFDEVTTDQINVQALKTQIPDQEKFITLVATTKELGTFEGFPNISPSLDNNERRSTVESGKIITRKGFETYSSGIRFEHTNQADLDLLNLLYDRLNPFLIWQCGGRFGTQFFSVEQKTWRLEDLYQVQTSGSLPTSFNKNVYVMAPKTNLRLKEEV